MKIAHISTFAPTQCGIATYTDDLIKGLPNIDHIRVRMKYEKEESGIEDDRISVESVKDYEGIARKLNVTDVDVIDLQHEFGIFGGDEGEFILEFTQAMRRPIVVTLHTISREMVDKQTKVIEGLLDSCERIVVLSEAGKRTLVEEFNADPQFVHVIRHGVPEVPFRTVKEARRAINVAAEFLVVTSGHIRPDKGYEMILQSLEEVAVDWKFLILGQAQPQFDYGTEYTEVLRKRIADSPCANRIIWIERFLPDEDLQLHIQAADLGIIAYQKRQHNSSGVLPLYLACGTPVIATDFEYAREMAHITDSVSLVRIGDVVELRELLKAQFHRAPSIREARRCTAVHEASQWTWKAAGSLYAKQFVAASSSHDPNRTKRRTSGRKITANQS